MALSDSFSQLAKKSTRFKLMLLFVVLLVFGFIYYQFRFASLSDEESGLEDKKQSLTAQQRKLDSDLAMLRELTAKNEELQRTIEDNQKALPTEAELPAFLDHLQRKAGDAGVSIRQWENLEEESVDVYVRVPVRVEVHGTFHELMHYFYILGPQAEDTLARGKDGEEKDERINERIVSIENLELGDLTFEEGEYRLQAKFIAATFRQDDPQPQAGAAQPGTPGRSAPAGNSPQGNTRASSNAQNRRRRRRRGHELHESRARHGSAWRGPGGHRAGVARRGAARGTNWRTGHSTPTAGGAL